MPLLLLALGLLVVTVVLFAVGWYRSSSQYSLEKRLDQIREGEVQTAEEELGKPFFQRVVLPMGAAVAKAMRKYAPAEVSERTQKKLVMAGLYPRVTPQQLTGLCWLGMGGGIVVMAILLIVLGTGGGASVKLTDPNNLLYLLVGALGGYMFPQFNVSRKVTHRQEEILLALPYAIDLLSISVEAGMGFDAGVGYTMRKIKGPLAEEFSKTLNEIRLGKPRLDALEDLGNRTGVEELKIFITAVVHASRLGGNITNTLRIQADSIRIRRRQRAQETAMKAPVKMVIPLVFFIFPALFVVLLGPAGIKVWQQIIAQ